MELKDILIINANGIGDFMWALPMMHYLEGIKANKYLVVREDTFEFIKNLHYEGVFKIKILDSDRPYKNFCKLPTPSFIDKDFSMIIYCSEHRMFDSLWSLSSRKNFRAYFNCPLNIKDPRMSEYALHALTYEIMLRDDIPRKYDLFIDPTVKSRIPEKSTNRKTIVLSPHSQLLSVFGLKKELSYEKARALIESLSKDYDVVVLGSREDYGAQLRDINSEHVKILIGKTSLVEAAAIVEQSDMFIGIDSGLMHIASVLNKRMIVLFGITDPKVFGPIGSNSRVISRFDSDKEVNNIPSVDIVDMAKNMLEK